MLVLFVIILAAPLIARDLGLIKKFLIALRGSIGMSSPSHLGLLQPLDAGLNDTVSYYTGSGLPAGYHSSSLPPANQMYTGNYNALKRGL